MTVNYCIIRNRLHVIASLTPINCRLSVLLSEVFVTVLLCLAFGIFFWPKTTKENLK